MEGQMEFKDDEITELKHAYGEGLSIIDDGGTKFLHIPRFSAPDGQTLDALFCPTPRDGYEARLFLSSPIKCPRNPSWTNFRIADRNWVAMSWKTNSASGRLLQILGSLIAGFR